MTQQSITRRSFLCRSAIGAAALSTAAGTANLAAAQPGPAPAGLRMKVGLYSITFLGIWYRGEGLPLAQVVKKAKQFGYDGMEIDGKRPHGNPLDWPKQRCQELRAVADGEGIEIYAVAANNDFSSPIVEHREAQSLYVRELIRMAADLGAKTVRLFVGWTGVTKHPQLGNYDLARAVWTATHEKFSEQETWAWCREGTVEAAKYAGQYGVTLALQNHPPVIKDHRDVLRMVQEVNSPNLKVCLDVAMMPDRSPEVVRQAARDVGPLQVLSHFGGEYEESADGTVRGANYYPVFIEAMRQIGYSGYIGYELCHPLPVQSGQTVGLDFAEKNARLACRYMRRLIAGPVKQ
jgi:sugar phosphate isomerase/epimerase